MFTLGVKKKTKWLPVENVQSNRFYSILSDNLYWVRECT